MRLKWIEGDLAICRINGGSHTRPAERMLWFPLPAWVNDSHGELLSITYTTQECSVVLPAALVPADADEQGVRTEGPWRAIRVAGTLDFSEVGVLARLTAALSAHNISVFVISTFDTDYLLVRKQDAERADTALRERGFEVGVDGGEQGMKA